MEARIYSCLLLLLPVLHQLLILPLSSLAAEKVDYREKRGQPMTLLLTSEAPLVPLGEIGGKNFTAINALSNWLTSLDLCHKNNLQLASIENVQQLRVLAQDLKYRMTTPWAQGYFWTSAHDFGSEGQFRWFPSGDRVSSSLPAEFTVSPERNCVQLAWNNELFDYTCEDVDAIPLCEG